MSDTPIDRDLSAKTSTRWPEFLRDRIDSFREEYNERIRESGMDDAQQAQFILDSKSDARRRLVDIGLAVAGDGDLPYGFEFDFSEWGDDADVVCASCGARGGDAFRVGATAVEEEDRVRFETVECQSCGEQCHVSELVVDEPFF